MPEKTPLRAEVPAYLTWDLTKIYPDEPALFADIKKMETLCAELISQFRGRLTSAESSAACAEKYRCFAQLASLAGNYSELAVSTDYTDTHNLALAAKIDAALARCRSELSFIESELSELSEETILSAAALAPASSGYLKEILRAKPYRLHPEAERVLSAISHTTSLPYEIYNTAKLADMQFDSFEADGETFPLSYSLFEDNYEYDPRTSVRRTAFSAFSSKIKQYENVTAAAYNGYVQHVKLDADLRGFENMYAPELFYDHVTRELYDRQIDLIMQHLAPHMRRYARLIGRKYKLDKVTFADLKLPLDGDYCPDVTLEQAQDYVVRGLSVLGKDYTDMIKTAFSERWIDFAHNVGKSTGGFCASPYGVNSFILMTWNGKMSDVLTLAHELGHAGHFRLCNSVQSVFDTEVSKYFVEAPSTMNELLMAHYLLSTGEDSRFRRWVLSSMIGDTYYHNCVTHLLEAAYQREVYRLVDAGGSVTAETLSSIMRKVLEDFWGDAVEINDGAELTWMRQPHYYMGLYSYTYSAGLTVATQVCRRIMTEGQKAVDDWLRVLTAGSTLTPAELSAAAGVDISTDAPLLDTIAAIGGYIDEVISLTEEIDGI